MPKLEKVNSNMFSKVNTGADYNRPLGILKDNLVIIDSDMASTLIVPTGFKYIMGVHELEVYVNGVFMRRNDTVNGITYGDYREYTNFSVKFNDSTSIEPIIVLGDKVRFRVTAANYKVSNIAGAAGIDPNAFAELQNDIDSLSLQVLANSNLIQQVGRDSFGSNYGFAGTPEGSTRTIGTITDGDPTPNLGEYRVWKTGNTGATSITSFDGCVREDQRIILVEDANTTFVHSASLVLSGSSNILGKVGDIFQFVYDGSIWRQFGSNASTLKWTQTSGTFTEVPASTSSITTTSDLSSLIKQGMALKYKIGGNYYYGICYIITSNLLVINGPPLFGNVTELWYDESSTKVSQIIIPINGYYAPRTELVTNGDFSSSTTGWTTSGSSISSVSGGYDGNCMQVQSSGAAVGKAYQDITTVIGKQYLVSFYFKKGTSTSGRLMIGTTSNESSLYDSGLIFDADWTMYTKFFTASDTTTRITCQTNETTAGKNSLFDCVYMVEVNNSIIETVGGFYIPWAKESSYCVRYSFISRATDTGTKIKPRATILINENDVNTTVGGVILALDEAKFSTYVDINSSNYQIDYGEHIEISVSPGDAGDAIDLTAILTFVTP